MSRASDYRRRKVESLKKLTVEATGETFLVRQVAIDAWIMAGRIPETLAKEVLGAWQQVQSQDAAMESMSTDQILSGLQVVRDLVVYACVSPKLVIGDREADEDNDEIHFMELDPRERQALIAYCMTGAGATVAAGGVTAEAVTRFSESAGRGADIPAGKNG